MTVRAPHLGCESEPRHCITCGDEGVLMRVVRVDRFSCLAICVKSVRGAREREEVAIDLVEPVSRGQTLLVHAGVALANLDQTSAALASLAVRERPGAHQTGPGRADTRTERERA
jgi:hydrogenase maturation factor